MSEFQDYADPKRTYPPGFRARRGLNWGSIGFMYAAYYLCRYNFRRGPLDDSPDEPLAVRRKARVAGGQLQR